MWRELAQTAGSHVSFGEPNTLEVIEDAQGRLGHTLPEDLQSLLLEMDAVAGRYGVDAVWMVDRIVRDNETFRTSPAFTEPYASFGSLVFFGDNGGGDQFAYQVDPVAPEIFVWDHETDERNIVAPSLREYLTRILQSDGEDWYK